MQTTPNLGLKKPESNEYVNVTDINENADTIDLAIGKITPLDADMTVYVATTGSDTTGDGTSSKPYKTITYALSQVPKDLGGYTATVNIADGTYNESVNITGYTGGYLYLKRNGAQELNNLCNIISISVQYCSNVSVTGFNLTNTKGTSVFANMCEFVNMAYCQSIVTTVSDEVSFNFDYVSVGRIGMCRSLNHNMCLRSYSSNVTSFSWSDDSWGTYGIFSDGGGRITKGNTFQPRGLVTNEVTPGGSIIASNYGARIGTLPADITLYVATTGSDTAGNGSSTKPYKTIQYAINTLPKDLGGYVAHVYIADGTYDEDLICSAFSNGVVDIRRQSFNDQLSESCKVKSIGVYHCGARIDVAGLCFTLASTTTSPFLVSDCSNVVAYYCQCIGSQPNAHGFDYIYSTGIVNRCRCVNKHTCLRVYASDVVSMVWANDTLSSVNGLVADMGTIKKVDVQPKSAMGAHEVTINGGIIVNRNGTQISSLITSGLSCNWGTVTGGYVRNGNLSGPAIVTIQVRVTATVTVYADNEIWVVGFPRPASDTAITCSTGYIRSCWMSAADGYLRFTPSGTVNIGDIIVFSCTYLTNS